MMRLMFKMFTSEVRGIHHAAYILATFTILSSLLAFLRDRIFAHTFGAGIELDLYFAAFRIPDLIFVLVASLVSAYILIPELVRRTDEERRLYIDTILAGFSIVIIAVTALVYVTAPTLLALMFPAFAEEGLSDTLVLITRIILLQPIFLGFSNIVASITQMQNRFVLFATAPLLYNGGIIFGVLVLYPVMDLVGIAIGVVLGAVLHVAIQVPSVVKDGFLRTIPRIRDRSALFRTAMLSLPRTLALSLNQVILLVMTIFAGTLVAGSITIFTFAFNLQAVPLAIIGASYSVAAFPTLARIFSHGDHRDFVRQVSIAARHIIFWTVPAIALLVVLRAHIVRTILGSGEFSWADTRLTAAAFALFLLSLTAHALMLLLVRGYYAAGRSFVPLIVNGVAAVSAIGLALLFMQAFAQESLGFFIEALLRVEDVPGTVVLALPLAYSVGALLGTLLLVILFERDFGGFVSQIGRVSGESIAAGGIGGVVCYGTLALLGGISAATTFLGVLLYGTVAGLMGLATTVLVFWFLGSRELQELFKALNRRTERKVLPVSSAEEEL